MWRKWLINKSIKNILKKIPINQAYYFATNNINLLNPIFISQFRDTIKKWNVEKKHDVINGYWYVIKAEKSYSKYLNYQFLKEFSLSLIQYKFYFRLVWMSIISLIIVFLGPLFFSLFDQKLEYHIIITITAILSTLPLASIAFGFSSLFSLIQKKKEFKIKFQKFLELSYVIELQKKYKTIISTSKDPISFAKKIDIKENFGIIKKIKNIKHYK